MPECLRGQPCSFGLRKLWFRHEPKRKSAALINKQGYEQRPLFLSLFPSQVEQFKERFGHEDYLEWSQGPVRVLAPQIKRSFSDGRSLFDREELPEDTIFNAWALSVRRARPRRFPCSGGMLRFEASGNCERSRGVG